MGQGQLLLLKCTSFLVTLGCNLNRQKILNPSKITEVTIEQELKHALNICTNKALPHPAQFEREEEEHIHILKKIASQDKAQNCYQLTHSNFRKYPEAMERVQSTYFYWSP